MPCPESHLPCLGGMNFGNPTPTIERQNEAASATSRFVASSLGFCEWSTYAFARENGGSAVDMPLLLSDSLRLVAHANARTRLA